MTTSTIFTLIVLSMSFKPSQQVPSLLSSVTDQLVKTPLALLKGKDASTENVKNNEISLPIFGKLGLGEGLIGQTISSITALTSAVQRGDFLLVGIKILELTRGILKTIRIPGSSELDGFLQLAHGVLETIHPLLAKFKQTAQDVKSEEISNGNGEIFTEIADVTPSSVFDNGMQFMRSLPNLFKA